MAAAIQEALEVGSRGLLLDEDTCATNFLVRDRRMELLVAKNKEPITPLIAKIRALRRDRGVSAVLVVGGCGAYLDVADRVIAMDCYVAKDVTAKAKQIAEAVPAALQDENEDLPFGGVTPRIVTLPGGASSSHHLATAASGGDDSDLDDFPAPPTPATTLRGAKSAARRTHLITLSGTDVDLAALDQLVHQSQSRCILDSMLYLRDRLRLASASSAAAAGSNLRSLPLADAVAAVEREWDASSVGIAVVGQFGADAPVGNLARPRTIELAAAINRVRGLRAVQAAAPLAH
ncbi:hypothetical protein HK405_009269 [Cladochytrium tenue]|nr:hypothetical protein HK405_009269 [Cladochytrium tenue]